MGLFLLEAEPAEDPTQREGGGGGGRLGLGPQSREEGAAPPECEEEAQRGLPRGHAGEGNNHKGRRAKGGGSLEARGVGRMLIQPNRPSPVIKHTKKLPSSKGSIRRFASWL